MVHQPSAARSKIKSYDPIWAQIREEGEALAKQEPALASFVYACVLSHDRLESSISYRLAQRLDHSEVDAVLLRQTFEDVVDDDAEYGEFVRADIAAVYDRDPACYRMIESILYFKGFHALQTHRFAHHLWHKGRKDYALYLQSQASRIFGVDIHPAAQIGRGLMIDHATGVVIGETAVIGDNTSILHGVTLGGSGKETGDRHPKIGRNVMIGAGASILGNIKIGDCARIASGSVVVKEVPDETTVAGVPAKVVGPAGCSEPSRVMDQLIDLDSEDSR